MRFETGRLGLICAFLALAFCSAASAAQKAKSVEDTIREESDLMTKECNPTDDQLKTLKDKFKAKQDALETWNKANADKIKTVRDAANAARKGTDADAKKKANGDVKALETEREQAAADATKAILAVLTDEQKDKWAGAQLAQVTLAKYKKENLSDDQVAKVKVACVAAAKDMKEFTGDDRKDKAGRQAVHKTLKWAIDNVILTPEQHGDTTAKPAPAKPATPAIAPVAPPPPANPATTTPPSVPPASAPSAPAAPATPPPTTPPPANPAPPAPTAPAEPQK